MPLLDWLNKQDAVRTVQKVPYRLLEAVPELSAGDPDTENMLIQGDNLQALKALLPLYAGKVKCIYIDPPYNIGSAFTHYDDNLEHSLWLSLMYPRLELLRELLAEDGSIWVSIDDREAHYLKVMMDEVFGRGNFIASNIWQKRYSRENREAIGDVHEYLFVYAKHPNIFKQNRNLVPLTELQAKVYKNPNNDPLGRWRPIPMTAQEGHATSEQFYEVITPSGKSYRPPEGRCWGIARATYEKLLSENRIYFGKKGDAQPNIIRYLSEVSGVAPWTWWPSDEVGHTDESKKEIHSLFGKTAAFESPKPERLIQRILHIATNSNDLILDSFLGSGTTAAVAHKMGRRYIGIEMGDHAQTHCQPRLKKVVEGEQGGISEAVGWQGGGGFHYFRLGETIFDEYGLIHPNVRFAALAAHLWFCETRTPLPKVADTPLLGIHNDTAYYLLYNGILGDRRPQSGNVLTQAVLDILPAYKGRKTIYGEASRFGKPRLDAEHILFKQIPYDVKGS
ncbi:site-specific DNA-methyltransferase [Methylovulum psychrotolerans]|uniref:Site-specific DNA-methyltransferase n=1 Tax=Methylovulum psychrotolerans TaxID=1704499 RepID=A0A2S5CQU3_9GAMM|nr:site-specific DNA-methyltransferase [Methylovulum psychrotolerans]POZ53189.1 site-specific DNA-methyltransferase [Methylovulum psychrotolerans]